MIINKQRQQLLLRLARRAIEHYGQNGVYLKVEPKTIPSSLQEKRGCFVTLTINNELRGCIGYLEGQNELWQDIIHNTISAGFKDPRFPPLSKAEIPLITIEISILTQPKLFKPGAVYKLLSYLKINQPGVIIKREYRQATYLPQVWVDLPDPIEFLTSLCHKAGMSGETWREHETEIYTYEAEYFGEENI